MNSRTISVISESGKTPADSTSVELNLDHNHQPIQWQQNTAPELIFLLHTGSIRRSALPNRDDSAFEDDSFIDLLESIRRLGHNTEPIKVQALGIFDPASLDTGSYEIVYGHRRWEACRRAGLPIRAIVVPAMPEDQVLLERIAENAGRADFSPLELGRICLRLKESKNHYINQRQLAIEVAKDEGLVSKAIQLASLPQEIIAAFPTPKDLAYRYAKPLTDAYADDPDRMLSIAKELQADKGSLAGAAVFKLLTTVPREPLEPFKTDTSSRALCIKGKSVGSISTDERGQITVQIKKIFEPSVIAAMEHAIVNALVGTKPQRRAQHNGDKA